MSSPSLPPATQNPTSRWSSLPYDLVRMVARCLLVGDLMDYVRFRAVYAHWRSATVSPGGRGVIDPSFHPRRWMMFPGGLYPGHDWLLEFICFFNLDSGIFIRVRLPPFTDHCVVEGLLLLQRDEDTATRLLHPFTGDIVELPPLTTILTQRYRCRYRHIEDLRYVSTSVSVAARVVKVLIVLNKINATAIATPQDIRWTILSSDIPRNFAPLSIQGVQYLVHLSWDAHISHIFQLETHDPPKLIAAFPREILCEPIYLVECNSEVLVVGHNDTSFTYFKVYKLVDLIRRKYTPVTSIGDNAIFLEGRSLCVLSKALPTITGNIIVYRNPRERNFSRDFTRYYLSNGNWSPITDDYSINGLGQGPCSLILHVFTCCSREYWNKGLMYLRDSQPLWKVKENFRVGA